MRETERKWRSKAARDETISPVPAQFTAQIQQLREAIRRKAGHLDREEGQLVDALIHQLADLLGEVTTE